MVTTNRQPGIGVTAVAFLVLVAASCDQPDTPGRSFMGIASVVYSVTDLDSAKVWYTNALGVAPYFEEPFYVGFKVGGQELGLDPDTSAARPGAGGTVPYWICADIAERFAALISLGAQEITAIQEVGGGMKIAAVRDPFGNTLGLIQLP